MRARSPRPGSRRRRAPSHWESSAFAAPARRSGRSGFGPVRRILGAMTGLADPSLRAIFQPDDGAIRALVVAGACGNVGLGKLGQFARLHVRHGIPVVALDLSPGVAEVKERLRAAFGDRFPPAEVDAVLDGITIVRGGISDL